jgi:2-methylaconitate cis-trans-isomerase PrpF
MTQTGIPYFFMRGGTSRGPYFNRADLPEDLDVLAQVLIAAVGSGHRLNVLYGLHAEPRFPARFAARRSRSSLAFALIGG